MLISFAECKKKNSQISEDKVVGLWISTENQYLPSFEKMCYVTILFEKCGTYINKVLSVEDNEQLKSYWGTWVIEKGEILCYYKKLGYNQFITAPGPKYVYDGKYIKNGIWTYEKQN